MTIPLFSSVTSFADGDPSSPELFNSKWNPIVSTLSNIASYLSSPAGSGSVPSLASVLVVGSGAGNVTITGLGIPSAASDAVTVSFLSSYVSAFAPGPVYALPASPDAEARVESLSALTNGAAVSTWGGFTAGNAATYRTTHAVDGSPYVEFDGVDDYLGQTLGSTITTTGTTVLLVIHPTMPASINRVPVSLSVAGESEADSGYRPRIAYNTLARYDMTYLTSAFPASAPTAESGNASTGFTVVAMKVEPITNQAGTAWTRLTLGVPGFYWSAVLKSVHSSTVFDRVRIGAQYEFTGNPYAYCMMNARYVGVWGRAITDAEMDSAIGYLKQQYTAR